MKINDKFSCNLTGIVDAFNNYFSSIAETLLNNNSSGYPSANNEEFFILFT